MKEISKKNTILSGEHFFKAELFRRGIKFESIPKKGNQSPEVLITNSKNETLIVQIKVSEFSRLYWRLDRNAEDLFSDDFFYVFMNLNGIIG